MDVFDFMKERHINLEDIFQDTPSPNIDLERGFKELQFDMEKQIRLWWAIASFELYISKKLTPRRLR